MAEVQIHCVTNPDKCEPAKHLITCKGAIFILPSATGHSRQAERAKCTSSIQEPLFQQGHIASTKYECRTHQQCVMG